MNDFIGRFLAISGRLNRLAYFINSLILAGIGVLVFFVTRHILYSYQFVQQDVIESFLFFINISIFFIIFISNLALAIRRLHDLNYSGWYFITPFIASFIIDLINVHLFGKAYVLSRIIDLLWLGFGLTLTFVKGTDGPNKYGQDPLKPEDIAKTTT